MFGARFRSSNQTTGQRFCAGRRIPPTHSQCYGPLVSTFTTVNVLALAAVVCISCTESPQTARSVTTPENLSSAGDAGRAALTSGGSLQGSAGGNGNGPGGTNGAGTTPNGISGSASGVSGSPSGISGSASGASGAAHGGSASGASGSHSGGTGTSNGGSNATAGGTAGGRAGGAGVAGSAGSATTINGSYSTNFDLTESPLSEKGVWRNVGLDWTVVASGEGFAFGTQNGKGGYNDSYAYLTGFPPNQSASAVIHLESGITASYNEVEILLRWSDDAHRAIGYECNLAHDGSYAQIIRWPGKLGTGLQDFTFLASGSASGGVHDGDVFSATVTGNTITSYLNGKQLATATDSAITSGGPGIAFYWEGQAGSKKYSFTSFTAQGLP